MTVTVNETASIEALDFTPEESCDNALGCDNAADWIMNLNCCKQNYFFYCNPCRMLISGLFRINDGWLQCAHCAKRVYETQVIWTPLKA